MALQQPRHERRPSATPPVPAAISATPRKRSATPSSPARELLRARYGEDFEQTEKFATDLFKKIDTNSDGLLNREEFAKSLGFLGDASEKKSAQTNFFSLANFMFDAIDTNSNGTIDSDEYLAFVMVMQLGSLRDKLAFAFHMVDMNHDGRVSKFEVTTMIKSIFTILTSLNLTVPQVDEFVEALCKRWNFDNKGEIDVEEYMRGCLVHEAFIKSLGYTPERIELPKGDTDFIPPRRRIGRTVFFGQEKWDFMLSVMLGLQLSVSVDATKAPADISPAAFTEKVRIKLPSDSKKSDMVCYAPKVFQDIRETFHVGNADYLLSMGVSQVLGSLLMGDLTSLSELVSEGKSGSFFYFSYDQRYMVKTISSAEARTLRRTLQEYHAHVKKFQNTLLTHYFGLYELKITTTLTAPAQKIYFTVMESIFSGGKKIHQRYDLKGSTQGRTVGEEAISKPGVVLRDLDFQSLERKINVGPKFASFLRAQIKEDTQFLQRNGIVDYSLLLGVHTTGKDPEKEYAAWTAANSADIEKSFKSAQRHNMMTSLTLEQYSRLAYKNSTSGLNYSPSSAVNQSAFKAHHGGMYSYRIAADGHEVIAEEILYLGIIDTLIPYELRKASEHILKSAMYDGKTISIVPPSEYAPRFYSFMSAAIE